MQRQLFFLTRILNINFKSSLFSRLLDFSTDYEDKVFNIKMHPNNIKYSYFNN